MTDSVLSVSDLDVRLRSGSRTVHAVRGVSFDLRPGRVLAVVGESGCGKSVTALTTLGLTRGRAATVGGVVALNGRNLLGLPEAELRRVRGKEIAMIFQDPLSALNPVHRVGAQIGEAIRAHESIDAAEARDRTLGVLEEVGMPDPARHARAYPHELSGGMRQRVMIAMALACRPSFLVADEPTTALDVTIQAQILALMDRLRRRHGMGILLITHDLGVVAQLADEIAVMYAGLIVERGPAKALLDHPRHPYTAGLLAVTPSVDDEPADRMPSIAGQPPSLSAAIAGCSFRARCPLAQDACHRAPPVDDLGGGEHEVRCWRAGDMARLAENIQRQGLDA